MHALESIPVFKYTSDATRQLLDRFSPVEQYRIMRLMPLCQSAISNNGQSKELNKQQNNLSDGRSCPRLCGIWESDMGIWQYWTS
jgi:hypothetical protein